jgi:hypothetical protein
VDHVCVYGTDDHCVDCYERRGAGGAAAIYRAVGGLLVSFIGTRDSPEARVSRTLGLGAVVVPMLN